MMTDSLLRFGAARIAALRAPMHVDGLPAGFDRDGQDWPTPRYVPTADGGYMIIAENVFDHDEGPRTWGMAVASSEWPVIAPASIAC